MTSAQFRLGPYTVRLRTEPGIQCALYHVYLGAQKIGASLSIPDLGCCDWLNLQQSSQTGYAYSLIPHRWAAKQRRWINPQGHNRHLSQRKKQA